MQPTCSALHSHADIKYAGEYISVHVCSDRAGNLLIPLNSRCTGVELHQSDVYTMCAVDELLI